MKDISKGFLIVANYNQELEIKNFLTKVQKYFPLNQTLVVDDGSTDQSAAIAKEMGFEVKYHGKNRGIGAAIRTGIEEAKRRNLQWVVISSSNGKIRPEDYETLYSPLIEGKADYVQGSRFTKGGKSPGLPFFRSWAIPAFSILTSLLMKRIFTDITCGARAYFISFLDHKSIDMNQEWLDRYELEYYIHYKIVTQTKARIVEVPVTIEYTHLQKGRRSKIRPFVGWWSMIRPFVFLAFGIKK